MDASDSCSALKSSTTTTRNRKSNANSSAFLPFSDNFTRASPLIFVGCATDGAEGSCLPHPPLSEFMCITGHRIRYLCGLKRIRKRAGGRFSSIFCPLAQRASAEISLSLLTLFLDRTSVNGELVDLTREV